jgi:tetratricopeptide (TPR) repeat protein
MQRVPCWPVTTSARWAILAAITVVLASFSVQAQPVSGDAKDFYRKGTAAYNLGRYREAAQAYERAYELTLDPALLFNVAQAYRLAGDREKAVLTYRSYLRSAPQGDRRGVAEAKLKELEAALNYDDPFAPSAGTAPVGAAPYTSSPPPPHPPEATVREVTPAPPDLRATTEPAAPRPELIGAVAPSDASASSHRAEPVYERWPFWAVVGGAAAAVLIVAIVATSGSSASPPQTDLGSMRF